MTFEIILRPSAETDIEESFNWYEDQEKGLGHKFRLSIGECLTLVEKRPLSFPIEYRKLRKLVVRHFPFSIYYLVEGRRIIVMACVHQKRHPRVWRSRQ